MKLKYKFMMICAILSYSLPHNSFALDNTLRKTTGVNIQSNNPDILNIVANQYIKKGHIIQAIPLLNKAAEQGNADSLITLMTLYEHGKNIPKDEIKAQAYLKKFLAKYNHQALFKYAVFYIQNAKNKNDYIKAQTLLKLYEKDLNDSVNSCYRHAEKLNKQGIPMICEARATDWPLNETIDDLLAVIAVKLHHSQNEVKNAIKRLESYKLKSDKIDIISRNETSMFYTRGLARIFLAQLYINGQYVPKNYHKAKEVLDDLLSLVNYQSIDAQYLLGTFYQHGLGTKKDLIKAQEYFNEACSRDDQKACNALNKLFNKKH